MAVKKPAISHRQRQAQATRAAVAGAARRLFADHGYIATTVEAISDAAEIPVPTIYSAFGNKPAILEEVRLRWIAETNVERLHGEALRAPDVRLRLRLAAQWTRRQFQLGYDVIAIYQEAAGADPRVAAVWRQVMSFREAAVSELLGSLRGRLRPGLTVRQALDLYVAWTLPEVYRTLVLERGWSPNRYESWLAELLIREFLAGEQPRTRVDGAEGES
jgi:AcrR family transcriptional regulator